MKYLFFFIIIFSWLNSASVEIIKWDRGLTFLKFLERENLPEWLYYNADYDDRKAIEDIQAESRFYVLRDKNGDLKQALIPLSEELQIHIYKIGGKYFLENIPIEYQEKEQKFVAKILGNSVYNDIEKNTNSSSLASFFIKTLKDRINFRRDIHKGSIVAMLYKRKYRLGYPFGGIDLKIAMLETGHRKRYVLKYDSKNYNASGKYVEKYQFIRPVKKGTYWLSSKFTKKRWHPILKKYRAHLGTDYAARRGTPIYSTGDGVIVYASVSRGYGNLIKIKHKGGYLSLYAHMKKFAKGMKRGLKVKQGQLIGYVGTTGLSTGPHLHFGFYKDGIAIDPEKMVSTKITKVVEKVTNKNFLKMRDKYKEQINILVKDFKSGRFETEIYKYPTLMSETALTSYDDEDDLIVDEVEILENLTPINEKREDMIYPYDKYQESLELSEDYQEY